MTISKKRATTQARKRKSQYKTRLKALQEVGAYNPKSDEITPYRITRINREWKRLSKYLAPDAGSPKKFFFVPATGLSNKERREFLANAKSLDIETTSKGLFLQKEGQRQARLAWNAANEEYDIRLSGKVKWGENKGKKISDRIPIGPVDRITGELNRIENVAKTFGPLKKGEAISFVVIEHGEEVGASRQTFGSPGAHEKLRAYIETRYHRDNKAARLKFLRMISVRKTTLLSWGQEHPPRARRMAKKTKRNLGYNPH